MKTIFLTEVTEYEAGWGTRPDGYCISIKLDALKDKIKQDHKTGSREYFWRHSDPVEYSCDTKTYNKIVKNLNNNNVYVLDKLNGLELYKKI